MLVPAALFLGLLSCTERKTGGDSKAQGQARVVAADPSPRQAGVKLGPRSEDGAIAIAKAYASANYPKRDIDQRPPRAEYFPKSPFADGGPCWAVTFAVPATRDAQGRIIGVRAHHGLTIYIDEHGQVINTAVHTP